MRPRPRSDGVVAEVIAETKESYDFWALRRNGDFYWRGSLFEDERRPGDLFFDTRIIRVTEALLYCGRLYGALQLDQQRVVTIIVRHVGLKGRRLSSASSTRYVSARDTSHEDESAVSFSVRLEQLESDLISLVKSVVAPMLALFDFFELSDTVYEEIVNRFVEGKV